MVLQQQIKLCMPYATQMGMQSEPECTKQVTMIYERIDLISWYCGHKPPLPLRQWKWKLGCLGHFVQLFLFLWNSQMTIRSRGGRGWSCVNHNTNWWRVTFLGHWIKKLFPYIYTICIFQVYTVSTCLSAMQISLSCTFEKPSWLVTHVSSV